MDMFRRPIARRQVKYHVELLQQGGRKGGGNHKLDITRVIRQQLLPNA